MEFILGLIAGACLGVFIMAILISGSKADDESLGVKQYNEN